MATNVPANQLVDSLVRCINCGAVLGGCACRPDIRDDMPVVTHAGVLEIGPAKLRCYVLENGQRIFDGDDLAEFLGSCAGGDD